MSDFVEVPLHRIAYARSGDKGNRLNIALIAAAPRYYQSIAEQMTESRVAAIFATRRPTRVVRYDLPKLCAFNFVLDDVLEGGVNSSLNLDGHGKSLSYLLLAAPVRISRSLLEGGENCITSDASVSPAQR
jgi:hypothetical protein|nr:MAG: hypothetical protein DIU57_17975 [Pseudomonadota bacterium]